MKVVERLPNQQDQGRNRRFADEQGWRSLLGLTASGLCIHTPNAVK
jgi:hypothetical protein